MKSKFANLTITELRQYVLDNNDDKEAFYSLIDRLQEAESSKSFPCPNNPDNLNIMKQAIREKLNK